MVTRDEQRETDRLNAAESLARINAILDAQQERELQAMVKDAELRRLHSSPHRPDETDTFRDFYEERDWERSAQEYEQLGGYR